MTADGVEVGTVVPLTTLCYYAPQNTGIDEETGERVWVGDPALWWLQERSQNKWQVYDPVLDGALSVTAIDFGDLLESTASIKQKQVRTEVSLLQVADETLLTALDAKLFSDPELDVADFGWANQPVFAAMRMSGAVPGTDQSINEIQGGDCGPGTGVGASPGTGKLIDPRTVKTDSVTGTGFDATVFSNKARLVIQKITGDATVPTWDSTADEWVVDETATDATVGDPVVDLSTAAGSYTAEINAGGSLIYGYNWKTTTADGTGTYRVTFVLESGANTQFDSTTLVANPGNINTAHVIPAAAEGDDGVAYVDISIRVGGGGGKSGH